MNSKEHFEALYAAHAGAVKGYAMRRTDPARADDVVADVFLVAWRRLEEIPSRPRPWLLGVARRVLANERRRTARHDAVRDRLEFARVPPALDDPADAPPLADARVQQTLQRLSDTDREALLLTAWEGLNHRDAARVLGVKEGTFSVRLHRAKRRLDRALAETRPQTSSSTRLETQ
jgi:RNA polymerase sigma-70 factor, ECF subfamily